MRKVPSQMGATTGNNGRTEGLPEVQEPVLEHAAPEANQTPRLAGRLAEQNVSEGGHTVNPPTIYLEGVALGSRDTPEGAARAAEIFARNERILFPLLRWGRNRAVQDTDSQQQTLTCDTSDTHPLEQSCV